MPRKNERNDSGQESKSGSAILYQPVQGMVIRISAWKNWVSKRNSADKYRLSMGVTISCWRHEHLSFRTIRYVVFNILAIGFMYSNNTGND